MNTYQVTVDGRTFEVNNVTAQRTSSYGHYSIGADIDGVRCTSSMNSSHLFDNMYREPETAEEVQAMEDAEQQVAIKIIRANELEFDKEQDAA
jgi:hypothetical protein